MWYCTSGLQGSKDKRIFLRQLIVYINLKYHGFKAMKVPEKIILKPTLTIPISKIINPVFQFFTRFRIQC